MDNLEKQAVTIKSLITQNSIFKREIEYLSSLSTMKDMGKKILGLREANRSLTRALAKKERIIARQSARITEDQDELAQLRCLACSRYGDKRSGDDMISIQACKLCLFASFCVKIAKAALEKEAKRKAYHNGK